MPKLANPLLLVPLAACVIACGEKKQPQMDSDQTEPVPESNLHPPTEVTQAVFAQWRDARRGKTQTESQNNPYWKWILESETSAFMANEHFRGPSSFGGKPVWEARRFGQSKTSLPDGRQILIAGEHEDHYDPDFFIYNDVIIRHPDGKIDFLGYPTDDFIPTDSHSATLVDEKLILIGNLGYPDDRKPGTTQILILNTTNWKIATQPSTGNHPGWIHKHRAEFSNDKKSIIIKAGLILPEDPDLPMIENIDDWCLHLTDWRWERLTERNWPLYEITRTDEEPNELWEMRQAESDLKHGKPDLAAVLDKNTAPETLKLLEEMTDYPLPKDSKALAALYKPNTVPHKEIAPPEYDEESEDEDFSEFGVTRIEVEGVIVRYVEDSYNILLTIEGELPKASIDALVSDLVAKLTKIDGEKYQSKQIRGVNAH